MTTQVWSAALRELAEPRGSGEYVKRAIERVAAAADLHYWRAFDIWYGKARRIDAHEAEQIEQALQAKRDREDANEMADLRARLAKMESRMAAEFSVRTRPAAGSGRPSVPACGRVGSAVVRGR
jgi:hypothetical protein